MKQEIHVRVKLDGTVVIKPKGFKGKGCLKATEFLEKDLGFTDAKRELTAEYHEACVIPMQKQTT